MGRAAPLADHQQPSRNGQPPPPSPELSAEAIRAQLEKILASSAFQRAERLSRFLRFTVEEAVEGRGDQLKEYVVGVEVFQRRETYDPRIDAVVRVEARRLRSRLKRYYETEGRNDPLWIDFPLGSYVPVFQKREPATSQGPPPLASRLRRGWKALAWAAAALLAVAAAYWLAAPSWRARFPRQQSAAGGAPQRAETAAAPAELSSIAILPFTDLSPEKDQEYFCDGMTDELISALTKVEGLRVLSQASAFQLKRRTDEPRQIGEQLRVASVLKGSVRKAGGRLRITAQLISVSDGSYLWSETYERQMKDLFAVQDEISRAIVERLRIQLGQERPRRLVSVSTRSPEAHNLYLQGRYYWNQRTERGLQKSIEYFEQAIALDPGFALAHAALADSNALLASYGLLPPREVMPKAKAAALEALQLDPAMGEAYAALGFVRSFYEWDWGEGERAYRRALELNPGYATVHHWYSGYLRAVGRLEEALAQIQRAQMLDPLSPAIGRDRGRILLSMRRYDQAVEQYRKTLELDPNFPSGYLHLGLAYEQKALYQDAVAACQKARALPGSNPLTLAGLGHCYARWGKKDRARKLLAELEQLARRRYVPAFDIALIHIGLDDRDRAFHWLEQAYRDHDGWLVWLKVDPLFDSLRSDPRFIALLKKLGLEKEHAGVVPAGRK